MERFVKNRKISAVITLLLSLYLFALVVGCTKKSEPPFKNVVLIIVDTLAVDFLDAYNIDRATSSNIDALAKSGTTFERAYSPSSWTKPSVSSIFTGVMPTVHGVRTINDVLPSEFNTLAERLKEREFKTAGFVSHTLISPALGYAQGFDQYDTIPFKGNVHNVISSEKVTDMGVSWLKDSLKDSAKGDKPPFFIFLHYFDPHNNYKHHEKFDRTSWYKGELTPGIDIRQLRKKSSTFTNDDIRYLRGLYEEEIAHTDHEIGRFLKTLNELGLTDETLIILTADHGEELMDRGFIGHSRTLYDELIRVPLIFSLPGKIKSQRISEPVGTLDILPTILDFFGARRDEVFRGASLKDSLLSGTAPPLANVYSEVDFRSNAIKSYKISVVQGSKKLILDKPTKKMELYDLKLDPKELINLADVDKKTVDELSPLLLSYEVEQNKEVRKEAPPPERSPEEIEQLKSLGYL